MNYSSFLLLLIIINASAMNPKKTDAQHAAIVKQRYDRYKKYTDNHTFTYSIYETYYKKPDQQITNAKTKGESQ